MIYHVLYVWEHAVLVSFMNQRYFNPVLLRGIVFLFFQCESLICFLALSGRIPEWREGSRCFIFLSMGNLNLMPLKIIYYCVNNVQIMKEKQTLGVKLSQSWPRPSKRLDRLGIGKLGKWLEIPHSAPCLTCCHFKHLTNILAESQHRSICVNLT